MKLNFKIKIAFAILTNLTYYTSSYFYYKKKHLYHRADSNIERIVNQLESYTEILFYLEIFDAVLCTDKFAKSYSDIYVDLCNFEFHNKDKHFTLFKKELAKNLLIFFQEMKHNKVLENKYFLYFFKPFYTSIGAVLADIYILFDIELPTLEEINEIK